MNIPQIAGVEVAIKLYYAKIALANEDIKELFPGISNATVQGLKQLARAKANELGKMQYSNRTVRTEEAYQAWGLDINSLERRLVKIKKYQSDTLK